jgi:hypothetical protein
MYCLLGNRYFRVPRYRSVRWAEKNLGASLLSQLAVGMSAENLKRKMVGE